MLALELASAPEFENAQHKFIAREELQNAREVEIPVNASTIPIERSRKHFVLLS